MLKFHAWEQFIVNLCFKDDVTCGNLTFLFYWHYSMFL